jgi:hypothetical protein
VPRALFDQDSPSNRTTDPDWMAERAAAHHQVIAASCPCLPLSFGVLFSGLDPLRAWLAPRADRLAVALRQAAAQTEWALTMTEDSPALSAWIDAHDPPVRACHAAIADAGAGKAFLMTRRLEKLRREARLRCLGALTTQVTAWTESRRFRLLDEAHRGGLPSWTVLVPEGEVPREPPSTSWPGHDGRGVVPEGLSLRLSGPWPAYAFARRVMTTAGDLADV